MVRSEERNPRFRSWNLWTRGIVDREGGAEVLTTQVRTPGHYEVQKMAWATDYVWMPAEEEVEERFLEEILHPWHAAYAQWVTEERAHPELQEWMEL
jgi:hypothetical protein